MPSFAHYVTFLIYYLYEHFVADDKISHAVQSLSLAKYMDFCIFHAAWEICLEEKAICICGTFVTNLCHHIFTVMSKLQKRTMLTHKHTLAPIKN